MILISYQKIESAEANPYLNINIRRYARKIQGECTMPARQERLNFSFTSTHR